MIKSKQGQILGKGTKKEGLYALIEQNQEAFKAFTAVSSSKKAPYSIWHMRMGHPNDTTLKFLNNSQLLNLTSWKNDASICDSCQMSKSYRLPFKLNNEISSHPLQKIHCDLWGHSPIPSCQNFNYYVCFCR